MSTQATDFCAPWCVDHQSDPTPESGWCIGERVTIGGVETHLTGDPRDGWSVRVYQLTEQGELSATEARQLSERLAHLAAQIEVADEASRELLDTLAGLLGETVDHAAIRTMGDVKAESSRLAWKAAARHRRSA